MATSSDMPKWILDRWTDPSDRRVADGVFVTLYQKMVKAGKRPSKDPGFRNLVEFYVETGRGMGERGSKTAAQIERDWPEIEKGLKEGRTIAQVLGDESAGAETVGGAVAAGLSPITPATARPRGKYGGWGITTEEYQQVRDQQLARVGNETAAKELRRSKLEALKAGRVERVVGAEKQRVVEALGKQVQAAEEGAYPEAVGNLPYEVHPESVPLPQTNETARAYFQPRPPGGPQGPYARSLGLEQGAYPEAIPNVQPYEVDPESVPLPKTNETAKAFFQARAKGGPPGPYMKARQAIQAGKGAAGAAGEGADADFLASLGDLATPAGEVAEGASKAKSLLGSASKFIMPLFLGLEAKGIYDHARRVEAARKVRPRTVDDFLTEGKLNDLVMERKAQFYAREPELAKAMEGMVSRKPKLASNEVMLGASTATQGQVNSDMDQLLAAILAGE